jgi:hypothetical protein
MKARNLLLLALPILLLIPVFSLDAFASSEKKVLSRNYVGVKVEAYAPYDCYPGENISVRIRVEAQEEVKNASVTVFIWGSQSEDHNPWSASFVALDVEDLPIGMVKEKMHNLTIPSDIDPGLTYGILSLDWHVYRPPSWENQWDKASFRTTYVKNRDYENLQTTHDSVLNELGNIKTLTYALVAATIALAASTVYLAKKSAGARKRK